MRMMTRPPSPPLLSPMSSPSCGALWRLPSSSQTDGQPALESSVCFCHDGQVHPLQVAGSLCPLRVVRSSCWVHGHASSFEIHAEHPKALVLCPSSKDSDQPGSWEKPEDRECEIEVAWSPPSHKCWPISLMSLRKVPQHNWNMDAWTSGLMERGQLRGKLHGCFVAPPCQSETQVFEDKGQIARFPCTYQSVIERKSCISESQSPVWQTAWYLTKRKLQFFSPFFPLWVYLKGCSLKKKKPHCITGSSWHLPLIFFSFRCWTVFLHFSHL